MVIKPPCLKSKDRRQENTNFKNAVIWRVDKKKNPIYLEFLLKLYI